MEEIWRAKRESDANEDSIIIFREKININSLPKRNRERERKKEVRQSKKGQRGRREHVMGPILFISSCGPF